jgi:ABC-type ATPase with predicted acetyltransferase domain
MKISCSRSYTSSTVITPEVLEISQLFGIGIEQDHKVELYSNLEIDVGPGRLVFITGESGAGKTSLLRDIKASALAAGIDCRGIELYEQDAATPIISLMKSETLQERTEWLGVAGLSEAFVYLRTFSQLSDGQRYRFMLAKAYEEAVLSGRDCCLFADEFCANLDRVTARTVAHLSRKFVSRGKIGMVVATTHDDIAVDLAADTTVKMRIITKPEIHHVA